MEETGWNKNQHADRPCRTGVVQTGPAGPELCRPALQDLKGLIRRRGFGLRCSLGSVYAQL